MLCVAGPQVVTDPAYHVTRNMEDFVTWVDTSKIRQKVFFFSLSILGAPPPRCTRGSVYSQPTLLTHLRASAGTDCAAGAAETMLPCPSLNLEEILQDAGSESPGRARRIGADRAAIPMQRPQSGSPPFATLQVMKFNDTLDDFDLLQA